MVTVLKCVMFS